MADIADVKLGLVEVVRRHNPDGSLATIAEVLAQTNKVIGDAVWREANDIFTNKSVRRSSIPTGSWRRLNQGVAAESSDTVEMVDVLGILESRAENDVEIINAFRDPAQARMDEARSFIEGMSQTLASTIFYGNALTNPDRFTGLAPRLDTYGSNLYNVINEGGSGDDTVSMYIVTWGPDTVFMAYPRNTTGGLTHEDLGIGDAFDSSGYRFRAYLDRFVVRAGLVVKNFRAIGRLANIEVTGSTNTFDEDNLIYLLNRMVTGPGTKIYANQAVLSQAQIRLKDKMNVNWSVQDGLSGAPIVRFQGFPVQLCEQIVAETSLAA